MGARMTQILLVGNPNCGKTTLFNALTGDTQRVGNWPGVTVEKKTGSCIFDQHHLQIVDLPGVYSLVSSQQDSQDAQITSKEVAFSSDDIIVNVVDACHLERHLYLTSQLLELGRPIILALNMMDIATQRGITIDTKALSRILHCPVVALQAHRQVGLSDLKQAIVSQPSVPPLPILELPASVRNRLQQIETQLVNNGLAFNQATYRAFRLLEGDTLLMAEDLPSPDQDNEWETMDVLTADARYQAIHQWVQRVQNKRLDSSEYLTAKIDRIVLHRFWSLPIFFAMMYFTFLFAINVGGIFQDFFDMTSDAVFVQGSAYLLQNLYAPHWLIAICAHGIGKGINTTLTFIPVMASMYFLLSFLETSGYMARAAFVVDRVMRALGLPGKAFVPMIVGFGCNVPAIMAARTLDSDRERILTILMSPFMSCSARLAIYAVFVAAFFPTGGQNVVFSLYVLGILMAVLTGLILRKTMLRGPASPLILELPAYHKPSFRRLWKETAFRLRLFVIRAGKLIIPVCMVLGVMNTLTMQDIGLGTTTTNATSLLASLGQWIAPIFSPMGLRPENWPAIVSLLTGMLAKEVVVGSLNSLYAQMGHLSQAGVTNIDFLSALHLGLSSITQNIAAFGHACLHPFAASMQPDPAVQSIYGIMYQQFDGKIGAYAYLLFVLLYIPCVSTMASIRQETNRKFMWFSIVWSLIVAYGVAVLFYQLAMIWLHFNHIFLYKNYFILAILLIVISFAWLVRGTILRAV
jgi:ferrous iron transport protein B